jgi:hypothetical protein
MEMAICGDCNIANALVASGDRRRGRWGEGVIDPVGDSCSMTMVLDSGGRVGVVVLACRGHWWGGDIRLHQAADFSALRPFDKIGRHFSGLNRGTWKK